MSVRYAAGNCEEGVGDGSNRSCTMTGNLKDLQDGHGILKKDFLHYYRIGGAFGARVYSLEWCAEDGLKVSLGHKDLGRKSRKQR